MITADLYGVSHHLRLMASVSHNVTTQGYIHRKTAFQSIQQPIRQSGQDLLSDKWLHNEVLLDPSPLLNTFENRKWQKKQPKQAQL